MQDTEKEQILGTAQPEWPVKAQQKFFFVFFRILAKIFIRIFSYFFVNFRIFSYFSYFGGFKNFRIFSYFFVFFRIRKGGDPWIQWIATSFTNHVQLLKPREGEYALHL